MADAFPFELVSPEKLVLSGEASEVIVPGTEGYFTVMANHAPLMSTIKPGVVEVRTAENKIERFVIFGGFADVSPSGLTLLAESAVHVDDFNKEELQARVDKARAELQAAESEHQKVALNEFLDQLNSLDGSISHGVLS